MFVESLAVVFSFTTFILSLTLFNTSRLWVPVNAVTRLIIMLTYNSHVASAKLW